MSQVFKKPRTHPQRMLWTFTYNNCSDNEITNLTNNLQVHCKEYCLLQQDNVDHNKYNAIGCFSLIQHQTEYFIYKNINSEIIVNEIPKNRIMLIKQHIHPNIGIEIVM
jgi:hypothetical protein